MVVPIPQAEIPFEPGTWFEWIFGLERIRGAALICPSCSRGMSIGGGRFGSVHVIDRDGAVSPSVVCRDCGWHVFVRLEGWNPSAPKDLTDG